MIEFSHVSKTYGAGSRAVKDVNLTIGDGEFVFVVGRSGSGKSTLIKMLLKEVEPTRGRIVVNDMDLGRMPRRFVPKYRRRLGVVFQDFRLLKDLTVFENVAFAQRVIGVPGRVIRETVGEGRFIELAESSMGAEDFSWYLRRYPGVYVKLGTGEDCPALHNSKFDFPDAALAAGIEYLVNFTSAGLMTE